jgi:hypothetical protein
MTLFSFLSRPMYFYCGKMKPAYSLEDVGERSGEIDRGFTFYS